MVPRRAVRGRRPWSEALTGGGPSIPLPSTRKMELRDRVGRPHLKPEAISARALLETRHGKWSSSPHALEKDESARQEQEVGKPGGQ